MNHSKTPTLSSIVDIKVNLVLQDGKIAIDYRPTLTNVKLPEEIKVKIADKIYCDLVRWMKE